MKTLVTGGAGFIGSEVVRQLLETADNEVIVLDSLTYAGNKDSLKKTRHKENLTFLEIDIRDLNSTKNAILNCKPDKIMHLAAESHVDNSISGPKIFLETNIIGTYNLLDATKELLNQYKYLARNFIFHHISTDEVYGSLGAEGFFHEGSQYQPNSPYSASKAASDHLVRSWHHTYGIPVIITNCSNNYGPYQHPEKLIPKTIINCINRKPIPIYGEGKNIRDWLYVGDHANALQSVIQKGQIGETYNIGGKNEMRNIEIVKTICSIFDNTFKELSPHSELIEFVPDRAGHDFRYAIDPNKIETHLNWKPNETFKTGIQKTIAWYIENKWWWQNKV